jgi:hypothetical protein
MSNITPNEAQRLINIFEIVGEQIQVERDKYECKLDCQRKELHSLREGLKALESVNKELRAKAEKVGQENERLLVENLIYQSERRKAELKGVKEE